MIENVKKLESEKPNVKKLGSKKANVKKLEDKRSPTEILWETVDLVLLQELMGMTASGRKYQAITFNLGGVKYTPDYMYFLENGEMIFVEVKGSKFQSGYAYSKARLKMAANQFPFFHFAEAMRAGRNWKLDII